MAPSEDESPAAAVLAMWWDIDLNGGRKAHEWYLPEGTLTFDQHTIRGREAIAETYRKRRDGTERVARHIATNIVERRVDDETVHVRSLVVLFAGNGTPPLPTVVPQLVADVDDTFVRHDGRWLISERRLTHVFIGRDTVLGVPTR